MSRDDPEVDRFCELIEHWVVLAAALFITGCATRNFSVLQLLKEPARFTGTINGGFAALELPKWFPIQDSIFEIAGGALYAKLRDLPLATRAEKIDPQKVRLRIDLGRTVLPGGANTFTLTYFPWFRFLSEPLNFDAVGRVADYVADCFRFLLARSGIASSVEGDSGGDTWHVRTAGGLDIEVVGLPALRSITVSHGSMRTSFDLDLKRIEIDRRMFPAAYEAGQELLKTPDRLINVDVSIDDNHLYLTAAEGGANVQA